MEPDRSIISQLTSLIQKNSSSVVNDEEKEISKENIESSEKAAVLKVLFPESQELSADSVINFIKELRSCLNRLALCSFERISMKDQRSIVQSIEIFCVMGVSPFLEEGVGFPHNDKCNLAIDVKSALGSFTKSFLQSVSLLELNLKTLSKLLWSEFCGYFLFSRFLPDFLPGVMQLTFSPHYRKVLQNDSKAYDRLFFCDELEKLMKNCYKPILLSELFILQGASKDSDSDFGFNSSRVTDVKTKRVKLKPAPNWLRISCGKVISDTLWLDSKSGVICLLETLLVESGNFKNDQKMVDERIQVVAEIVLTIPKHKEKSEYLRVVVAQIWSLFCQVSAKVSFMNTNSNQESYKKFAIVAIHKLFVMHNSFWMEFIVPKFENLAISELNFDSLINCGEVVSNERFHAFVNWYDLLLTSVNLNRSQLALVNNPQNAEQNEDYAEQLRQVLSATGSFNMLMTFLFQKYAGFRNFDVCQTIIKIVADILSCLGENAVQLIERWVEDLCELRICVEFDLNSDGNITGRKRATSEMDFAIITHSLLPFLAENVESLAVDWILNSLTSFLHKDSLYEQCTEKESFSRKAKHLNLYAESLQLFFSNYSHILYSNVETFLKCSFTIMKNVKSCDVSDLSDFLVNIVQILLSILTFLAEVKQGLNSESLDLLHNNATEIESWKTKIDCSKSEIDEFSESKNTSTILKELQNLIDTFFVKYRTSFGTSSRSLDSNLPARNPTDEKLSSEENGFREAFGLMHEALLPLRAAGMKNVSKLVKNGNKYAVEKLPEITATVLASLEDEDSYLYLSAAISLANISLYLPANQISRLLTLYCNTESSLDDEFVSKLGESVTRVLVERGEMIVANRNQFLNTLLFNCKADKSWLIRASSFANLAVIVEKLGPSLHLDLYEITYMSINAVKSSLLWEIKLESTERNNSQNTSDKKPCETFDLKHEESDLFDSVERDTNSLKLMFKRSSVMLLSSMVKLISTKENNLSDILDGAALKEIYNVLSKVYQRDNDVTCRLHAQMGIETVNSVMKKLLTEPVLSLNSLRTDLSIVGLPKIF